MKKKMYLNFRLCAVMLGLMMFFAVSVKAEELDLIPVKGVFPSDAFVLDNTDTYRDRHYFNEGHLYFHKNDAGKTEADDKEEKEAFLKGYMNKKGEMEILLKKASPFNGNFYEGMAMVEDVDTKRIGYIDKKGKEVIKPKYQEGYKFSEDLALIKKGVKYGFINTEGKEVIKADYFYTSFCVEGLVALQKDGYWGFVNKKGKVAVPFRYDFVEDFSEGLALFKAGDYFGFVDKKGEEVIEPQFISAYGFRDGVAMVQTEDQVWNILKHPLK